MNILEQRIASLEDTIEGMSNEFLSFGDRLIDSGQPGQPLSQRQVLDDLKRTTGRFLHLARSASSSSNDD